MEPNCTFRILNSWIRVIMLFIESTRNTCIFFEKDSSDVDKIGKTLFTMFLSERVITQRYNKKGFIVHVTLIRSDKGNHEFIVWNFQRYPVAEPGLSRTPGRVLSIDVHKLTVQKIHENINGKIDNIQKAPSRSNIFILLQQLIQVQR